jgi:hypothetical protein
MTPEAKSHLSATIRALRVRLLEDLHGAVEREYRLGVRARDAGLKEVQRIRRERLEAWIDEAVGVEANATALSKEDLAKQRERFRRDAEKQAAYTLLNRLLLLRLMEAPGPSGQPLREPAVVTNGWESPGYKAFRELAPSLRAGDETEGYHYLLKLIFFDLGVELPGLFGPAGVADLVPIPSPTLRHLIECLDDPALASCWSDDMTLGWVYQYWNDPEREEIDKKLNARGKVEPHEIASKTQMFTERYMVDWLLQNSLGPMWLAICRRNGWVAEVESQGVLDALEKRRAEWRKKRDHREVSLTDLMPLHSDMERRWAYYLLQPLPEDAVAQAPSSVRDLKLLDPAVGSGHFLVVAFDLLFALYQEEARHRGETRNPAWQPKAIVESIVENNLHGIDLDPRAVQIAAAAVWLKAKQTCVEAAPRHMNLVASALRLAGLREDDPSLVELRREVEREAGIPARLTDTVIQALRGADHLGSLLKIDKAVDEALGIFEKGTETRAPVQQVMFGQTPEQQLRLDALRARANVVESLEKFLAKHTRNDELGLRLHGEQLATGVRFVRLLQEGQYDLVIGNPPYQGTTKMRNPTYVQKWYCKGKGDLYAAFMKRGVQLLRTGGSLALLTMRDWMFITQYSELRRWLLSSNDLRAIGDLSWGAFEEMRDNPVVLSVFRRAVPSGAPTVAIDPSNAQERVRTGAELLRKRAGLVSGVGCRAFDVAELESVTDWPLVYWWPSDYIRRYASAEKVGDVCPARNGMSTQGNTRFLRRVWETAFRLKDSDHAAGNGLVAEDGEWAPYIKGAAGRTWFEPLTDVVRWQNFGLEVKSYTESLYGSYSRTIKNEQLYFRRGIAFSVIGSSFTARAHRVNSIFGHMGASIFPQAQDVPAFLCMLNTAGSRFVLSSLNPGLHFLVGDVNRLPVLPVSNAAEIYAVLEAAFTKHERGREASVEFARPGSSPWGHAQAWAQRGIDRPNGADLERYVETLDSEPATNHIGFALGVALGRFGSNGEGIRSSDSATAGNALPAGIGFLDGTLDPTNDRGDSLGHAAARILHEKWATCGSPIDPDTDLRTWLRLKFFASHRVTYENRPIHWPLSSKNKTFVAWINIHRWNEKTLRTLLADHLNPTLMRLEGELDDLRAARDGADKKAARNAERRFAVVKKAQEELADFIKNVEACAERGPPPTDPKCAARDRDARFVPDLHDGVMINSAALWPLLEPQWKDPKKWWKELSNAEGKKDYDWSHLAMRYWPSRVDAKCQTDPSLAVAHGCFWKYHPARAWAWELRLQDEIGPDFRIEAKPYDPFGKGKAAKDTGDAEHRKRWLAENPKEALDAVEKEAFRRVRKHKKALSEFRLLEPGLWSALPEECWQLEERVARKQGVLLTLIAPDEAKARKALLRADPDLKKRRAELVAELVPALFLAEADEEEEGEDTAEGAEAPDEDEEEAVV